MEKALGKKAFQRLIPKTKEEVETLKNSPIIQPNNPRILKVALIGLPNSGKSTLTNKLIGWRVCSVSKRVHTTRHQCKAIFTEEDTQVIFVDTPGVVSLKEKQRFKLGEPAIQDPEASLKDADLAIILVDAANVWTRLKLDGKMLRLLKLQQKKSILVLNKVDLLKSKDLLLDITWSLTKGVVGGQAIGRKTEGHRIKKREGKSGNEIIKQTMEKDKIIKPEVDEEKERDLSENEVASGWSNFDRVFMVSALNNDGIPDLKHYIMNCAKSGRWLYPASLVTDQSPTEITLMAIKEKLLDHLPSAIPYSLDLKIEMWEVDQHGVLRIIVLVFCPRMSMMKFVIGGGGKTVSQIADEARQELMNTFRCEVSLKLIIQTKDKKK